MNELQQELFERQLNSLSQGLDYPRTPNIAGAVMARLSAPAPPRFLSRRLAWSLTVLLVLCSSLMLIPPVRAAVIEFIQIGVVRIFRAEPTPLAPPNQELPSTMAPVTATPGPTLPPLIPVLEGLAGEVTLDAAQHIADYPILLPSYPPELGQPGYVFVQEAEGAMTILVWMQPQQPDQVWMSLHLIPAGSWAITKMGPRIIQETTFHGQSAIWAVGPYPLQFSNGKLDFVRLVNGHVLIWTEGEITYRLETDLGLEEALKIAESLEPIR
jgi:hypothetical protein